MAILKYEVVAQIGTYKDRDGNEKQKTLRIGAILQTEKGFVLKLDAVPVGWEGWAYLNEPKPREEKPKQKYDQNSGAFADFGDDIPY